MQKEENEEWIPIDEDIPVAATLTDVEICQAVCEQHQAIKVDDSNGDECVEENHPMNAEMRQAFDILKRGVQHRSINFKKQHEYEQCINELFKHNCRQANYDVNEFLLSRIRSIQRESIVIIKKFELEILTNLHVLDLPESEKHNFGIMSVCVSVNTITRKLLELRG
ncbi:hypothetical protein AVEN_23115-1 [Araneus ventricosus]|uniref:Uncharacterized protein n=1 Tax=Araneus ventricosus TaxID=182803 RepID=A0A4Y2VAR2_ARAVE|nr:hypothetical protein AVEN_23115-1 [Araneus ventricosus]